MDWFRAAVFARFASLPIVLVAWAEFAAGAGPSWTQETFEDFAYRTGFGHVARDWTPWFDNASGGREWNIVPGENGWAQELRKSNVRLGLYRALSGLEPGETYRVHLRARWLSGSGPSPNGYLGMHPGGGSDPGGVVWSEALPVSSRTSWTTLTAELTAPAPSVTIFIQLDYTGVHDYGVAIDNLVVEPPLAPGNLPPRVTLSAEPTVTTAPGAITLVADASDPDGSIASVAFYEGGRLLHADTSSPFSFRWSDVEPGVYSLTAVARDDSAASTTSSSVSVSVTTEAPGVPTDPGLVWVRDAMDVHDGELVKGWSKWSSGAGSTEWRIVPGEGGWWAQEVRKTNVNVGIERTNRGFVVGDAYRVSFRARKTSGIGAPNVHVGIAAGDAPSWSPPVPVSSMSHWVDVRYELVATAPELRLVLRADLTGLADTGVAFDHVSVELLSPRDPEPWMLSGAPPVEPENIHGIHDTGAEDVFVAAGRRGWVTEALAIGSDPTDVSGRRFPQWIDGLGVICRIAHGFGQILPEPGEPPGYPGLDAFATRAANFVKNSTGCGIWSIGNEPHLEGVADPLLYAEGFVRVYRAIKEVRPQARVITAGFVHGDLDYFLTALDGIEARGVVPDGIALHTYTDSQGWNETTFQDYQLKIASLPESMRALPIYITEAGTGGPGNPTVDTGLVDRMFDNVHRWNLGGGQQVRAVCLYRWTAGADKWSIEDNPGMRADFVASLARDYRWFPSDGDAPTPAVTLTVSPLSTIEPGRFDVAAVPTGFGAAIDGVELFANDVLIATDAIAPYVFAWMDVAAGSHRVIARVHDETGVTADSDPLSVTVTPRIPPTSNLVVNGSFDDGLAGWTVWTERGAVSTGVMEDAAHIDSVNHNGGLYQSFGTGGTGRRITITGSWGSNPTAPSYQWAEVLVINGPDLPVEGEDVVAGRRVGNSPVVLIYKNDTWTLPEGWSGPMAESAVINDGAFVSAGDEATIVLKSGNLGGESSGTRFDDIVVH